MVKVGIFGGSFNPIHNAHLLVAKFFKSEMNLDTVYFVPAYHSPFKERSEFQVEDFQRIKMIDLAITDYPNFHLLLYEIERAMTSFTIETIKNVLEIHNNQAEVYLLIGTDQWNSFDKWKNWQEILKLATVCIANRDDKQSNISKVLSDYLVVSNSNYKYLPNYKINISSSTIRNLIAKGEDISTYVPDNVRKYIADNRLYLSNNI